MYLEVKATKTYQQYLEENPNFFDSMREFAWDEDEQKYVNVPVKEVTKDLIESWFGTRIVCSDADFERYFARQFNLCSLRYSQLSRIELSAFDPLVADYMEKESINNSNRTSASSRENSKTNTAQSDATRSNTSEGSVTNTRTPDITRTDSGTRNASDSSNDTKASEAESHSKDVAMNKVAPQSISYAAAEAGKLPSLDWKYATAQDQRENETGSTGSESNTHTGSSEESNASTSKETGTDTSVNSSTNTTTGSDHSESSGTEHGTENGSSTESGDSKTREVQTGRGGLTPQDAFKSAVAYLKTSSAWEWMRKQLEECFLCIYDI